LAVLELIENEQLAELERRWWIEKGQCGSGGTFMKVGDRFYVGSATAGHMFTLSPV